MKLFMERVPTGIAIIGTLHVFSALFLLIHVLISIPFIIMMFFEDAGLGFLGTVDALWDWILLSIHATLAGALFTRKKWSRNFIIGFAIIGLTFGVINFLSGNMFAIFTIILDVVVIAYMRKPSTKAWFTI